MSEDKEEQTTELDIDEGLDEKNPLHIGKDAESRLSKRQKRAKKKGETAPLPIISPPQDTEERASLIDEEQSFLADRRKKLEAVGLIGTLKNLIAQFRGKENRVLKTPASHSARI